MVWSQGPWRGVSCSRGRRQVLWHAGTMSSREPTVTRIETSSSGQPHQAHANGQYGVQNWEGTLTRERGSDDVDGRWTKWAGGRPGHSPQRRGSDRGICSILGVTSIGRTLVILAALANSRRPGGTAGNARPLCDPQFRQGFLLSYADSSKGRAVEAVLDLGDANNVPAWRLCQWATKYSLGSTPCIRGTDGDLLYENEGKRILVGGPNSPNRDLILEVRGGAEYGDKARRSGEGWPHLLIEQDAVVIRPLDELAEIRFSLDMRLLRCESRMPADQYDPGLHAAQFQMFSSSRTSAQARPTTATSTGSACRSSTNRCDVRRSIWPGSRQGRRHRQFIYSVDGRAVGVTSMKNRPVALARRGPAAVHRSGVQEAVSGATSRMPTASLRSANLNLGWEDPGAFDAAVRSATCVSPRSPRIAE